MDTNRLFFLPFKNFEVEADDLVTISELGRGAYGVVEKVRHAQSGTIMAVKVSGASPYLEQHLRKLTELQVDCLPCGPVPHGLGKGRWPRHGPDSAAFLQRIRATVNSQEQKRLLMDLDINMRTVDCFYTVTFYGALFREVGCVSAHLLPTVTAIPPLLCAVAGALDIRRATLSSLPPETAQLGS